MSARKMVTLADNDGHEILGTALCENCFVDPRERKLSVVTAREGGRQASGAFVDLPGNTRAVCAACGHGSTEESDQSNQQEGS